MRGGAACADGAEWTTRDDRETDHETVEDIEPNAQKGAEASQLLCAFYDFAAPRLCSFCWRPLGPEPAARRPDGARLGLGLRMLNG